MKRADLETDRGRRDNGDSCTGGPPQCALAHASSAGLDVDPELFADVLARARKLSATPILIGHSPSRERIADVRDDVPDPGRFIRKEPTTYLTAPTDGGGSA